MSNYGSDSSDEGRASSGTPASPLAPANLNNESASEAHVTDEDVPGNNRAATAAEEQPSDFEENHIHQHSNDEPASDVEENHVRDANEEQSSDYDENHVDTDAQKTSPENAVSDRDEETIQRQEESADADPNTPGADADADTHAEADTPYVDVSHDMSTPKDDDDREHSGSAPPVQSEPAPLSPTQEDLFGDADDVTTSEDEGDKYNRVRLDSDASHNDTQRTKPEETADQEEEEEIPENLIDVEIPKISANLGNQLHFVKFPNFLSVEPRPFDQDTYEDEIDDDDVLDEEGRSRVKLKVENTIRWKLEPSANPDEETKRMSNAKIVRWSDGSMSLYLGSEVFDVHTHPLQGDHHHLFIRQGTGLQGRAIFRTKLTFRPHSTESFTHRKMTMSMADRTNKTQKVKVLPAVGKDPEALKLEMMKKEEERLKASARRESQQRRKAAAVGRHGLSASYLEPDRDSEDENSVSISAIKKSYKAGGKDFAAARAIYETSDEDDGGEADGDERSNVRKRRGSSAGDHPSSSKSEKQLERAKRLDSDDDEEDADSDNNAADDDGDDNDDDEEEEGSASEKKRKRVRANVIEDDDDED